MRQGAKTQFARNLRKHPTDAEIRLWFHLRRNQLGGARFRRQHPIGPHIVDFICVEQKVIIGVDGSQHLESSNDAARDAWLRREGYHLLRFWNNDVLNRTEDVLAAILKALELVHPHPGLPQQTGGGVRA